MTDTVGPQKKLSDEPSEDFRQWIEMEVLRIMRELVSRKDVQSKRVKEIANRTLELVRPGMTMGELFQNAIKLNNGYPELDSLVIKLMKEYEQKYKHQAIEQVTNLVENGHYDEAQNVVKKVLEFKMAE
ncbi:hypothetical protein A3F34_01910 [Candidatus Roizmanbacteria bacterium RIFCSPHIGHO2_12_FULL_44_10]|uniref:Uncharacterized protein n=1 Tax=Candidatus Roizmanbacteria bacterium RIFCSPHIGHO2_12_FULL_44_10 TaxID=1802054 RepID=A0A1F7I992_9BACT|nr:MAG: hypothetical protein A3F34_01910 [Candidatus Roizmanbacteria bacterium RIFCSPHIGHO2_12_FULL_44_10]